MSAKLRAEIVLGDRSGDAVAAVIPGTENPQLACNALASILAGIASGTERGSLRLAIDEHTPVAASDALTITQANIAAAEYIEFRTPGGRFRVTAVASGAADGDETFNTETDDDTTAANIRDAINTHPRLKAWVTATVAANVVTVTAIQPGTWGNDLESIDGTVNGVTGEGLFTGGKDARDRATATIAITHANLTAADTVSIGATTITARASGAVADEFNIGADATADASALATAINASTSLLGIVTASASSGTVTLTYQCDANVGRHIRLATSDATAFTLTQPTSPVTVSNKMATRAWSLG